MAKLLTRGQILSAPVPTLEVEVPELGGVVKMRALSPRVRAEMFDDITVNERAVEDYEADQALEEADRKGVAKARTLDQSIVGIIYSVVDDEGNREFTMADYDAIYDLPMPTIRKLWEGFLQVEAGTSTSTLKKTSK